MLQIRLLFALIILSTIVTQAQEPRNITRAENETDVFIPCPFGFRPAPSIWKINGTEYFGATLPPVFTQIPGGLFINRVNRCLNHTSFQCIDTSGESLQGEESDIGFLTVTSERGCAENDEFFLAFYLPASPRIIAVNVDHQRTVFGSGNTTLAWIITTEDNNCTTSKILSYLPCESRNIPGFNVVTNEMEVTIQSENLRISGHLADFNISSLSDQPPAGEECPALPVTIRVNVMETKQLNLLAGNNNCTCVNIECKESLHVAISKPDMRPPDVLCPIYILSSTRSCYSADGCNRFSGTPFFRICESQNLATSSDCNYNMCFGNITEKLNGTRLDFYELNKTMCESGTPYPARIYVLSFELIVKNASANISVDTTAGEICFYSSPQECSLTQLTQYNVSITDLTRNLIFMKEMIPETSCVNIQAILHRQCYPYFMSIQPLNNFITYNSIHQLIEDDAGGTSVDEPDVCSCINKTVRELSFTVVQETSIISIEYFCSTDYLTPLNIMVIMAAGNETLHQRTIVCSTGRFSVNSTLNQCGQTIEVSAYWIFTEVNDTMSMTICSLSNYSVSLPCPTLSPIPNNTGLIVGIIITVTILVILVIVILVVAVVCIRRGIQKTCKGSWKIQNVQQSIHRANIQERGNDHESTDSGDQSQDVKNDDTADATL